MPWTYALLRGQKVVARANADGSFAAEGGRVEIRYRKNDPRVYRASAGNLARVEGEPLMADGEVVEGVESAAPAAASSRGGKGVSGKKTSGEARPVAAASPDAWVAFTDGACSGNPGPAGAGMVVIRPGGAMTEGYEYLGTATNNIAELTAILRALEAIPADAPQILVHTDSQYSIGVLQKGWKAKVNQELIAKTKSLLAKRPQARLVYVPGHAGVPMNERADELAREAISRARSKPVALG
jgi:ribonuclease HI